MNNKFLEKIASWKDHPVRAAKSVAKAWKETSGPARLSMGLSGASLAVGTANYENSRARVKGQTQANALEGKSLDVLKDIHKTLAEKQAADRYDIGEEKDDKPNLASRLIGASFVGGAAAVPFQLAGLHSGRQLEKARESGANAHTVRHFMKNNDLKKHVTFNTRPHSLTREEFKDAGHLSGFGSQFRNRHKVSGPAAYHPTDKPGKKGFVFMPDKSPNHDTVMHELGHVKDFAHNGKIKRMAMNVSRNPVGKGIVGSAVPLAMLSNEKTRDYAPAVAAVPGAMMMREEMAANYHAYKGIKAHSGKVAANKFLKHMGRHNMLNYGLIGVAAPVVSAYVGGKVMDTWDKKKDKE